MFTTAFCARACALTRAEWRMSEAALLRLSATDVPISRDCARVEKTALASLVPTR